jgi:hypothetical protein
MAAVTRMAVVMTRWCNKTMTKRVGLGQDKKNFTITIKYYHIYLFRTCILVGPVRLVDTC